MNANPFQKRLLNIRRNQQVLYILIFSFVTVIFWVIGSLVRSQKNTGISADLQRLAIPLNPIIDESVLTEIERQRSFGPEELRSFSIYRLISTEDGRGEILTTTDQELPPSLLLGVPSLSPSPVPSPTPVASPSAALETSSPSATASPSGSL